MNPLQRVLYVEDEPDIRAIAQLALEVVGGLSVKLCASGEEALACVADFAPDLILLDVMMPGLDGPATLDALRAQSTWSNVPVAFMTAKVQPADVAHYKSIGACDVIAKPFDPMTLADNVRAIWHRAHGQ